jgi:tetratricopeptide (TPR) repeat protein
MKNLMIAMIVLLSNHAGEAQTVKEFLDSGMAKNKVKNYGESLNDFTKALEIDPRNTDAYFLRGTVKLILDDNAGALADLNQIKELLLKPATSLHQRNKIVMPNESCLYCHSAYAKSKLDDPHGAIADYDKSIRYNPQKGESYYRRALAKLMTGDRDSARLDFIRANEKGYSKASNALKNYFKQ